MIGIRTHHNHTRWPRRHPLDQHVARFAVHFREITGDTPADYLASWRITLAQGMRRAGRPLKHVALEVGYGSSSALMRAFLREIDQPLAHWLRHAAEAESTTT